MEENNSKSDLPPSAYVDPSLDLDPNLVAKAKEGDSFAQLDIGKNYYFTTNIRGNSEKGFHWFTLSAQQRNMEAEFRLGDMYALGEGVEKNEFTAYDWYLKSALQGYPKALTRIHNFYHYEKSVYSRGQLNSGEEEWVQDDFKKENAIRELYEYRALQLGSRLTKIKEYFVKLATVCQNVGELHEIGEQQQSCLTMGFLYQHGYGVKKSINRAMELYQFAAEKGNVDAQYNLGFLYQQSTDKKWRYREAFKWFTLAAENGSVGAQENLAFLYLKGLGTGIDIQKTLYWYTKAAEGRNVKAQISLSCIYRNGTNVGQDYKKAIYWYKKAIEEGSTVAQNCLEQLYSTQISCIESYDYFMKDVIPTSDSKMGARSGFRKLFAKGEADFEKIKKLVKYALKGEYNTEVPPNETLHQLMTKSPLRGYSKKGLCSRLRADISEMAQTPDLEKLKKRAMCAFKGDANAMLEFGLKYYHGDQFTQDKDVAFRWIRNAAKAGLSNAQFLIATMYKDGDCVEQDYHVASMWYHKAAKKGNGQAQYHLGMMYYEGLGVQQDYLQANKWLKLGAYYNNGNAQLQLDVMQKKGRGLRQDLLEAIHSFTALVQQSNPEALDQLALIYDDTVRVELDTELSLSVHDEAAHRGNQDSQIKLGDFYSNRDSSAFDMEKAVRYYTLASNQGNSRAKYRLAILCLEGRIANLSFLQAYNLFKEASDLGNSSAANIFSIPIDYSKSKDIDYFKIISMFEFICDRNIDSLEYNLARLYQKNFTYIYNNSIYTITADKSISNRFYEAAAEKNVPEAQYNLGVIYERGERTALNLSKAVEYYTRAHENGYADATYKLASMYHDGYGVSQNLRKAFHLYNEASDMGHKEAYKILHLPVENLHQEKFRSVREMITEMAESGNVISQYQLGCAMLSHKLVQHRNTDSIHWLTLASQGGHADASYQLGLLYENSELVKQDYEKAFQYYQMAADKGKEHALHRLAQLYQIAEEPRRDYAKAFELYNLAAKKGVLIAQFVIHVKNKTDWEIGRNQLNGFLNNKQLSYNNFLQMWEYVASKGNSDLQYELGQMYQNEGEYLNPALAVKWYSEAAKLSHSNAIYCLGVMHEQGQGINQNCVKATEYYEKSGTLNNMHALYRLGLLYLDGEIVPKDSQRALNYLKRAAKEGHSAAMFTLGKIFEEGQITNENKLQALKYYNMSASKGYIDALNHIDNQYGEITPNNAIYYILRQWHARILRHTGPPPYFQSIDFKSISTLDNQLDECIFYNLGCMHYYGYGTSISYTNAWECFTIAKLLYGSNRATDFLTVEYKDIDISKESEYLKKVQMLEMVAQWLTYEQVYELGLIYYRGVSGVSNKAKLEVTKDIVKPNKSKASKYFAMTIGRKSSGVDQDYDNASYYLGMIHYVNCIRNSVKIKFDYYFNNTSSTNYPDCEALLDSLKHNHKSKSEVHEMVLDWYIANQSSENNIITYNLGWMFSEGFGTKIDLEKSFNYYKIAASKGHIDAKFQLGFIYENGYGIPRSYGNAINSYRGAVTQNHVGASFRLGEIFFYGIGAEINHNYALKLYKAAANFGYSKAQYQLGLFYANGYGTERNYQKALEWYTKAADQDQTDANFNLGQIYFDGEITNKDYKKAFYYYKLAADKGHSNAQFQLGSQCFFGLGVEKNYTNALEWYTKAAEQNHAEASFNLGQIYFYSISGDQNVTKSYWYYVIAADKEHAEAQFQLGSIYEYGFGVEIDYRRAVWWYTRAASNNHSEANFKLTLFNRSSQGDNGMNDEFQTTKQVTLQSRCINVKTKESSTLYVNLLKSSNNDGSDSISKGSKTKRYFESNNEEESLPHYRISNIESVQFLAESSDIEAEFTLAEQYLQGQNIPQDTRKAFDWYMKSALHGYPKALSEIYRLYHHNDKLYRVMDMKCYSDTKKDDANKLPDIKKYFSTELILYQKAGPEDSDSQQKLGFLYQHGFCVKKSSLMAIEYYKSAAKKGLVGAQLNLGYLYQNHEENEYSISAKEKNYREAFNWYVRATKSDNNVAQNHLAYMYLNGFGVKKDLRAALNLYKISAFGGNINSQLTLAKLYRTGKYVTLDLFESANWYNMAALQGSKAAKNCMYMLKKPKWKNKGDSVESRAFEINRYFTSSICLKLREDVDAIAFKENHEELKLLSRNALVGDGLSMFRIGLNYCDGIDFPKNEEVGFKWIAKAAKTGYHEAQYTLGTKYETMAKEKNLDDGSLISDQYFFNASIWYKKAAEQNHSEAQCSLGILYENGFGVGKNLDSAEEWYTKSAEGKNPEGQYHLGISTFSKVNPEDHLKEYAASENSRSTKTRRAMEKAIYLIKESYKQDNPEATYMMGLLYENGVKLPEPKNELILINPDPQSAKRYYESAARIYKEIANHSSSRLTSAIIYTKNNMDFTCKKWTIGQVTSAQLVVGRIYSGQFHLKHVKLQNTLIQKSNDISANYYKMASDNGDSTALYELACLKLDESKTKQDFEECYKLFQMVNQTGRLDARILFDPHPNRLTTIDPDQFLQMLLKNVDMGYAIVEYQLGYFYEHSSSIIGSTRIKQSYPQAIKHYRKAAEAGYSYAQHQLGNIYEREKGASRDLEKAFHFYNQASTNGHKDSDYRLACMYYNGEGTEKNMSKAFKFYKKAAEGGNLFAEEALDIDVANNSYDHNNFLKKLEMYEAAIREYHNNSYMLAAVYEDEDCPFYDLKKAIKYYTQAVEFNIVEALYRLELLSEEEINEDASNKNSLENVIKRYEKYIHNTTTANGDAMYRLALLYLYHKNDKNNYKGAFDLLTKAHDCGYVWAEKILNLSQNIYISKNIILSGGNSKTYHEEIIKMYEAVAAQGNNSAQYKLGTLYEDKLSIQDYSLAEEWYSKAANSGHKNALYRLGKFYQEGKGVKKPSETSISFYIKAAEAGCESSLSQLAIIIKNKNGTDFKLESRMNHFRKLASTGNTAAQYTLGYFFFVKDNLLEALRWLSRSYLLGNDDPRSILESKCDHENESSQYEKKESLLRKLTKTKPVFAYYEIAKLYYSRTSSLNDLSMAFKNYWIAANDFKNKKAEKYIQINMRNTLPPEENEKFIEMFVKAAIRVSKNPKNNTWISEAQYQLGLYSQEKYKDLTDSTDGQKSYDGNSIYLTNAIKYLQDAAKYGHVKAAYELSMIYLEVQKFDKAKDYLKRANDYSEKTTKKKDSKATYQLGKLYLEHEQDFKNGLRYLKESAELGNSFANNELGLLYKNGGKNLHRDYKLAFEAFQKAAEKDHPVSQFNLALLYQTGEGVEKNESLALQWYEKSAQNGNKQAGFQAAMMHMKGEGTFQNTKRALEYLEKYSDSNNPEVRYYLSQLKEQKGDTRISLLQDSARAGSYKAQYELGMIYLMGDGVVQDYNEAFNYLYDAADNGNIEAQSSLGWLYENGKGTARNPEAAIDCYKKSNHSERKEIQYRLGILQKYCSPQNYGETFLCFKNAADKGHVEAKYQLGLMYEEGLHVDKDYSIATKLYQESSEQGIADADYRFGLMHIRGDYFGQDYLKAIEHFESFEYQHSYRFNYSADIPDMSLFTESDGLNARELYEEGQVAENGDSLYKLALIYRHNQNDQNNSIISNLLFFQAAKKEHCEAEFELGLMYMKEKNIDEAKRWINSSAKHGNVRAKNFLGCMFAKKIFSQNTLEALPYFNDAATLGDIDAQFNLGSIYHYGKLVQKGTKKAIKWYKKSAGQGCAASQFALGLIYKNKADYVRSFNYFQKAAEQYHSDSQYFLGWMYENGFGTEKNVIQANEWYEKSKNQESHSCSIFLAELYHCANDTATALKWYKKALDSKYISFAERGMGLIHEYEGAYGKAFQLYNISAKKGNMAACYDLGRMHYYGKGVEKNTEKAINWFRKAKSSSRGSITNHIFVDIDSDSDAHGEDAIKYSMEYAESIATKAQSYLDKLGS